jgi:lysine biosynthesis protein LysW
VSHERQGHQKARCPECLAPIWIKDEVEMWDPVTCHECHTLLEVTQLRPLTLDYVEDDEATFEDDENWQ